MTTMRVTPADRTGEPLSHTQKSTCTMHAAKTCQVAQVRHQILVCVLGTAPTGFHSSQTAREAKSQQSGANTLHVAALCCKFFPDGAAGQPTLNCVPSGMLVLMPQPCRPLAVM